MSSKRARNGGPAGSVAADGAVLSAASCSGALPAAKRLIGSWLTRKAANMAKPQHNARTEAATAAIMRRTLGNIRPRCTAARSRAKHASQSDADHREGRWRRIGIGPQADAPPVPRPPRPPVPAGATLTESPKNQCKKIRLVPEHDPEKWKPVFRKDHA